MKKRGAVPLLTDRPLSIELDLGGYSIGSPRFPLTLFRYRMNHLSREPRDRIYSFYSPFRERRDQGKSLSLEK